MSIRIVATVADYLTRDATPNRLAHLDELESRFRLLDNSARLAMAQGRSFDDQALSQAARAVEAEIEALQAQICADSRYTIFQLRRIFA